LSYQVNYEVIDQLVKDNNQPGGVFHQIWPVYDGQKNLYTRRALELNCVKPALHKRFNSITIRNDDNEEEVFAVNLKPTLSGSIDLSIINDYVAKKLHEAPLDAIQVLDIILRHAPSINKIPVGFSLFGKSKDDAGRMKREDIGGGRDVVYGHYQSIRACEFHLIHFIISVDHNFLDLLAVNNFFLFCFAFLFILQNRTFSI